MIKRVRMLSRSLRPHGLYPTSVSGTSQEEYWSGLPFPPPADLSDPGIMEPESPASPALVGGLFTTETPEKSCN